MILTTQRLLLDYIKTGTKPLWGAGAFMVDEMGTDLRDAPFNPPACACPIGVACLAAGHDGCESGTFCEVYHDNETGEGNTCWVDGFVAGWEETDDGKGFHPEDHSYAPEENPDGLRIYKLGYANGQRIRRDFIKLGLRGRVFWQRER